jgi:hypothetical protein
VQNQQQQQMYKRESILYRYHMAHTKFFKQKGLEIGPTQGPLTAAGVCSVHISQKI